MDNNNVTLIVDCYDKKITINIDDGSDMRTMVSAFQLVLKEMGFREDRIERLIIDDRRC